MTTAGEEVTNATYRQVSGLDSRVVTRELGDLVQRGLVEQTGTGRWTTYRLAPQPVAAGTPRSRRHRRGDRRNEIVALLRRNADLSRAEIAEQLDVSGETATRWLTRLRSDSVVELTTSSPRDPNARYRLREEPALG